MPLSTPIGSLPLPSVLAAEGLRGLIDTYILESPVLGALAALLVGILVAEVLRRTGRGRPAAIALATAAVIGVAFVLVGGRIQTPRERVTLSTRSFVDSVVAADHAGVGAVLADKVSFRTDGRPDFQLDRDWMVSVARGLSGVFKQHSLEIQDVVLTNNDTVAQARFLSRATFTNEPIALIPSTWELTWRLDPAARVWRLHGIECLTLFGKPASSEWINWGNRHKR